MILAVGLTPAWQQILLFDKFVTGEVNRAAEAHWCASGKVLNVGLALHRLGGPAKTLALVGGAAGEAIEREFRDEAVSARWIQTTAPTRVCTTILDQGKGVTTELVENSPELLRSELDAFQEAYAEEAAAADLVVFSGSLPTGTPPTFYRDLLECSSAPAVLDIRSEELLHTLSQRPLLVKPNREELARTLNCTLADSGQLTDAMREINRRGARWVAVTDGGEDVWVTSAEATYRLTPPRVENVVNPIGCGDCLAAGFAWAIHQGKEPVEALRIGLAAAAENLPHLLPARLDPSRVLAMAETIRVV